jgi:hypothetical protein
MALAGGAGLLVCAIGFALGATLNVALVAAFGAIILCSVQGIRRVGLANWATGIFVAVFVTAAVMVILWRYDSVGTFSPYLQFATGASAEAISVARRLLSDTGALGAGAGTYGSLLPIYQELDSPITKAPSTASALVIELGWPIVLFVAALAVGTIVVLYRGALLRGRDSFYPAAAAACCFILLGQAFCDASLLNTGVAVIGDAVIGLGLAQSIRSGDGV